ncbi:MAG: peptidylprolyl isomerase [Gammaproteobacteria bacterium]
MNESLTVAEHRVVQFHYVMKDSAGVETESSAKDEPTAVLFNSGSLMPSLERALEGRTAGDQFDVTLEPDDAFGQRREDWTQRISKKYVSGAARLKTGMQTTIKTEQGPRVVTVLKVGGKFMDVDLNHPLAGQRISFHIEIVGVREATPEEIDHGHAHGAGGHQH